MVSSRVVLVAALVGAVAACGSSSGDSLTKGELIREGDALCQQFLDDSEAVAEPTDLDSLLALLDDAIARGERTLDAFKALDPPSDGEDVLAALVKALEDSLPKVREARAAAAAGDTSTAALAMDEATEIGQTSDEPAKAYGFQVCGSEAELRAG